VLQSEQYILSVQASQRRQESIDALSSQALPHNTSPIPIHIRLSSLHQYSIPNPQILNLIPQRSTPRSLLNPQLRQERQHLPNLIPLLTPLGDLLDEFLSRYGAPLSCDISSKSVCHVTPHSISQPIGQRWERNKATEPSSWIFDTPIDSFVSLLNLCMSWFVADPDADENSNTGAAGMSTVDALMYTVPFRPTVHRV
jgi:hypothetical protein